MTQESWQKVADTITALGLDYATFRSLVREPAQGIVTAALANASADGEITSHEIAQINWLLDTLIDDPSFAIYVLGEIDRLVAAQEYRRGNLPSLQVSAAGLRAGEIVHAQFNSQYVRVRQSRTGEIRHPEIVKPASDAVYQHYLG